jgi:mRNA interferase RelE/StbE
MYSVIFAKSAIKSLRKMPRNLAELLRAKLEMIAMDPYASHTNVTKLQNRPGYRLRVGDWRVIYEIQDDELIILVIKVGPRGDIYR